MHQFIDITKAKKRAFYYSAPERMKGNFICFTEDYGGQVFVVYSIDGKIKNLKVVAQIADKIVLLSK